MFSNQRGYLPGCRGQQVPRRGSKFPEQDNAPEVCDSRGIEKFVRILVGGVVDLLDLPNAIRRDRVEH